MQTEAHPHHHGGPQKKFKKSANGPLLPRQDAPKFTNVTAVLANNKFKKLSLDDFKGILKSANIGKYVVLLFYPFDFTYVCPTELHAFSDAAEAFHKLNAEVIGVSVDSHFTHLAWKKTPRSQGGIADLAIPLLADIGKTVSKSYGVLVTNPDDDLFGATLRGLYIIDGKQVIRHVQVNDAPGLMTILNF